MKNKALPIVCALVGVLVGGIGAYILFAEHEPPARPLPTQSHVQPEVPREAAPKPAPQARTTPALTGSGVITGRVTLADDQPLSDVAVTATAYLETTDAERNMTLEERVAAFARRRAQQRALQGLATSGADGRFRVEGLDPKMRYEVAVQREGYTIRNAQGSRITYYKPGSELTFVAEASTTVTVDMRLPDGTTPDVGRISLLHDGEVSHYHRVWSWWPTERTRELPPGEWTLTATGGELNEYKAEPVTVQVTHGEPPPAILIEFTALTGVAGRVITPSSLGEATLRIELLRLTGQVYSKEPAKPGHRSQEQWIHATTGWQFIWPELEPGEYRVQVTRDGSAMAHQDVSVTSGLARVEVKVPEPDPADYRIVRVLGPDGPAFRQVYVGGQIIRINGSSSARWSVWNRGNGEFWIERSSIELGEGETCKLHVNSSAHGTHEFDFDPHDTAVTEVVLAEPAWITVEIAGFDAHPQKDLLQVGVAPRGSTPRGSMGRAPRRDGTDDQPNVRRFGPLVPGDYVVGLSVQDERRMSGIALAQVEVSAASGENPVTITPPQLYSITVLIPEEYRKGFQLNLIHIGEPAIHLTQHKSGVEETEFKHLKPGRYRLQALPAGQMIISIPQMAGQRVVFSPLPFNAYRIDGELKDADLPLLPGDHVIEIDGQPMTDSKERQRLWAEATKLESTTWVVVRDGATLPLTFDGRELAKSRLRGASARVD